MGLLEQKRDLAIVLRAVSYEERHRVVTALTENHGRVSAMARNSIQSRRFGGTLEPFAASEWRFAERPGGDLYSLEGAEIRRSFENLRRDFRRLSVASALNELMLKLAPEREACPDLFRLHSNALAVLDELPAEAETAADGQDGASGGSAPSRSEIRLLNAYIAKLLQWGGNQPRLGSCLRCGKSLEELLATPSTDLACAIADAGWSCCGSHRGEETFGQRFLRITPRSIVHLGLRLEMPIRRAVSEPSWPSAAEQTPWTALVKSPPTLDEELSLFGFLEAMMLYHLPGLDRTPIKSLKFLGLGVSASDLA